MGHLRLLDVVMMTLYASAVLSIGWWYGKRARSSDDYFVAGRGARSWVVGISMIAALFSTIGFLGTPTEMMVYGPGLAWSILHAPLTFIIVGFLIIPHIMRYKVTSGYELLEQRFGMSLRKAASLLFIFVRLLWMSFILFLCSSAVSIVTEIPLPYVLAIIGVIATASTVMGGIRAVLATDVLQFVIHVGAGLSVILYVAYRCGGMQWLFRIEPGVAADLNWEPVKVFSLSAFDRVTIVGAILTSSLWWICTATSDQMMIQRFLCTPDAKTARRSFLHCIIGEAGVALVLWGIGAALLAYFLRFGNERPDPTISVAAQASQLFPHFIATVMPEGLRGILVAALFADAMQSLSSGISALGTVLVVDVKGLFARDVDRGRLASRAKLVGLGVGIIALLLSYVIGYVPGRSIMDMTFRISGLFTVPLFVVFALAFFVPFSTSAGAWVSIGVGLAATILFSFWKQIVGLFGPTGEFSVILIMPLSLVLSLGAGMVVSLFSKRRQFATAPVLERMHAESPAQPS